VETRTSDPVNMKVLLLLAIAGAVLAVIGWLRYFSLG
jgi:hypothetical protein